MVVPTANTTQQKFLIGLFPKIDLFLGHNADIDISVLIRILPTRFSSWTLLTHIYICHTSHILWENLQAYNIEGTVQQEKEHKTKEHAKL